MIQQELLNGSSRSSCSNLIGSEQPKFYPSFSPSPLTTTPASSSSTTSDNRNNLRCPRCDSSNTKFCYYNNYNLTQPRHFCKTCRRYWTKGGALRNIPIGGGCRKNKTFNSLPTSPKLIKTLMSSSSSSNINGISSLINGLDHSSILGSTTTTTTQNSHIQLALMSTGPTQNHNPMSNPFTIKTEAQQQQRNYQQQGQNGFVIGEVLQNTAGMPELYHYQRMRSSPNYYSADNLPVPLRNLASSSSYSSASSTILELAPVGALGKLGHSNPSLSWSDGLPTTNGGAYIYNH